MKDCLYEKHLALIKKSLSLVAVFVVLAGLASICSKAAGGTYGTPGDYRSPGRCEHITFNIREEREDPVIPGPEGFIGFTQEMHGKKHYDVELPELGLRNILILVVNTPAEFDTVKDRTASVVEKVNTAFDIMRSGGSLEIEQYDNNLAIWSHKTDLEHPIRVLTVTEEDTQKMDGVSSLASHAEYKRTLLRSYYSLFVGFQLPEKEPLVENTRTGRILKRIYLDAKQHAKEIGGRDEINMEDVREAIYMLGPEQRLRLYRLPFSAPFDWENQ